MVLRLKNTQNFAFPQGHFLKASNLSMTLAFGVGWAGVITHLGWVGWGNNIHVHLHTMVMLRYEIVSSIWGGVGWGNHAHVHLHTMVMLGYEIVSSIWGGVGWGNHAHVHLHTMVMLHYEMLRDRP